MREEHIKIEILYSHLPAKLRSGFDFLIKVLGFFFFAIMTRQTFLDGLYSYLIKQSTWGILPIKVWIPKLFIFVGCLSFSLHFFGSFLGDLLNLFRSKAK
jgi:TRAP-type C4-dicarboxylate transport system permease small subunit